MYSVPVALASQVAARNLEKAVWTKVCDSFFCHAAWASDLLAILAIEQVFEGVQAVV